MMRIKNYLYMILHAIICLAIKIIPESILPEKTADGHAVKAGAYRENRLVIPEKNISEEMIKRKNRKLKSMKQNGRENKRRKYPGGPGDSFAFYWNVRLITHISLSVPMRMAGPHTPAPDVTILVIESF